MSEESGRRDPLKYPKKWGREETFYRDIVTRTLSILISSAFLFLGAIILGYARRPETAGLFWLGLVVIVSTVLIIIYRKVDSKITELGAAHFAHLADEEDKILDDYAGRRSVWEFNRSLSALAVLIILIMIMVGLVLVFFGPEPSDGPITEGMKQTISIAPA